MPDNTPPVVIKSEIIAQFIPLVAAASGLPKHVEQAYNDPAKNIVISDIVLKNDISKYF